MTFNPRSYKRSDTFVKGLKDAIKLSIHAPTRGATNASSTASADSIFQSTFLQEERQFLSFASGSYFYFQSTLLQEERRPTQRGKMRYLYLSIHAPTRGATTKTGHIPVLGNFQSTLLQEERPAMQEPFSCARTLSIHAPTRGATVNRICHHVRMWSFNPRSYKRSDALSTDTTKGDDDLSIHAPTRGATTRFSATWVVSFSFNPRSYKRSDFILRKFCWCVYTFNPRSYKRSDGAYGERIGHVIELSIHAPTRGATMFDLLHKLEIYLSIHAPTRGATESAWK